jgi:O-antigen/teichoic acid export membrane protein
VTTAAAGTRLRPLKPNRALNLLANYLGTGWTVLIQLLLVPVYIRLLGVESYGLVGFYLTIQAVLVVLDLGLGSALNRELARRTAGAAPAPGTADMVRTLEAIYWLVGLGLGLAIAAGSSALAQHWVNNETLPPADVARTIALMGMSFAVQWPIGFYGGGLLGLQRQTLAALVNFATVTVFGLGVVGLLMRFRSLDVFFIWRALTALVTVVVLRRLLWSSLRGRVDPAVPRFRLTSLTGIVGFSLGMSAITLTGMVLSQVDKIVLSKLLPLDRFGSYMLATTAASLLPQLVSPLFTAVFPWLSQAIVTEDREAVRKAFHLSAQLIALIVYPAAFILIYFSRDILLLWTGSGTVSQSSAGVLSLLALGALLNSVMVTPYTLQIASGWTRLSVTINAMLLLITIPYAIFATMRWGALGAAATPVVLNGLYVVVGAPLTFRRLLGGEGLAWLKRDVVVPMACIAGAGLPFLLLPSGGTRLSVLLELALAGLASYLAALLTAPLARHRVLQLLAARKPRRMSSSGT